MLRAMTALSPDEMLERTQWDTFWVPPDVHVVSRPELMYLRSERPSPVLNAVLRLRTRPGEEKALVDEVSRAHADHVSRWSLTPLNRTDRMERELEAAGYSLTAEHFGYTIAPEDFQPRPDTGGIEVRRAETLETLRDVLDVMTAAFGGSRKSEADDLEYQLEQCTGDDSRILRFVAYDTANGEPISSGGLNVYPDLRMGYLWAGATVPHARGRGAYSRILAHRIDCAQQRGCRRVGVYAHKKTSAPIVEKQGLQRCGEMVYWDRGPQGR